MKPSNLARRRASHSIVFGDPKSGKSTLVAELLMRGYNLTWVSMDNGHEVIFKLPLSLDYLDQHLNIIVLPDTKDFPIAIKTCLKIVTGAEVHICDAHGAVDCSTCKRTGGNFTCVAVNEFGPKDILVFDHLGQLANSAMAQVFIKGKKGDDDKPEWEDYARQGTLMDRFLTNIQQATYNVICITHVTESEMEDGTKRLVPLVGTTPFSRNVGKYFDHMIHCQVLNRGHKFGSSTGYATKILTGSRSDVEIEKEEKPSLVKFLDGTVVAEVGDNKEAKKVLEGKLLSSDILATKEAIATLEAEADSLLAADKVDTKEISIVSETPGASELKIPATPPPVSTSPLTSSSGPVDRLALLNRLKKGK